ncbi:hypothetical protein MJO29_015151 [Puccinia striiformis f. sp. tritici]|nr:hypothetical protein MJO29_015151 [Puccinia striiformis f. sp. tritici]
MRSLRVGPVPAGEGVPKNTSSQAAGKGKGKGARNKNQKGKGRQTKTRKKGGDGQSDDSDENETEKTSIALPEEEEVDDDADPNLDDDSQILPNAHQVERASTRGRRDRTTGTSQADQETTLPRLNKENRTIAALPRKVTQAAYTKTTKNTKESASTAPATAENEANAKAKGKRKRSVRIPPFDSQANRSENGGGKFHNGKWRPKKLSQSKSTTSTSPDPEERPRKELTIHVSSGSEDDSD